MSQLNWKDLSVLQKGRGCWEIVLFGCSNNNKKRIFLQNHDYWNVVMCGNMRKTVCPSRTYLPYFSSKHSLYILRLISPCFQIVTLAPFPACQQRASPTWPPPKPRLGVYFSTLTDLKLRLILALSTVIARAPRGTDRCTGLHMHNRPLMRIVS